MLALFFMHVQQAAKITRDRIQEEHAMLQEQSSTYIQIILSAKEASSKEFKRITNKGNKEQLYLEKTLKEEKLFEKLQRIFKKCLWKRKIMKLTKAQFSKNVNVSRLSKTLKVIE